MNLDWKKIGVIAMFVGAVVLFAFFLWYFFWQPIFSGGETVSGNANQNVNGQLPSDTVNINGRLYQVQTNGQLTLSNTNTGLPVITPVEQAPTDRAQGGLTKTELLINETAFFAAPGANGNIYYYNPNTAKFYYVSPSGVATALSDKIFNNVQNVTWSNGRERAVLEYPDGSKIVYDFTAKKQTTLPKHWQDFSFSPSDDQLAFKSMALDPENRFLAVAKYDGSQTRTIESIGGFENQFQADWSPNNQMVATFNESKSGDRSEIYFVGLNKENFKSMIVEGRGFSGEWSPDGNQMVYSVYNSSNNYKPRLWVSDTNTNSIGDNRRDLGLETWADKCSFATADLVYCAVPTTLPYGAGIDQQNADIGADQIYKIDLATGAKQLLAIPDGNHNISQIIANPNSNSLFFIDKNSNRIYRIEL